MRIPAWERENFRLNKGNIFPSKKSLVSDIPSGEGKTAKHFFTVYKESMEYIIIHYTTYVWLLYVFMLTNDTVINIRSITVYL